MTNRRPYMPFTVIWEGVSLLAPRTNTPSRLIPLAGASPGAVGVLPLVRRD